MSNSPRFFVISGPSGAGKGTVVKAVKEKLPYLHEAVSATTRSPREDEKHGEDYWFFNESDFEALIDHDRFLEWAMVHGNYYGTLRDEVDDALKKGNEVILEIDPQGAFQIKEQYPDACMIFLKPPSIEVLRERLVNRGLDSPTSINMRLKNAEQEIKACSKYDHVLINENLDETVQKVVNIIQEVS